MQARRAFLKALLDKASSPSVYRHPFTALAFGSAAASAISVEQRTHLFNLNRARRCPKSLGRDVYIAERSVRSGEMCAGRTQQ